VKLQASTLLHVMVWQRLWSGQLYTTVIAD